MKGFLRMAFTMPAAGKSAPKWIASKHPDDFSHYE